MLYRSKFGDDTIVSLRVVNPVLYRSTFLWPLNNLRNSIFDSVFNLNIWGDKQYNIGSRLNQNSGLTLNHNFVVKNNKTDKKQCYSIPRTEILLILRCQHVTRQIISNFQIWHSPNRQLSSLIEISVGQGNLTQQSCELLWQLHCQWMLTFLMFEIMICQWHNAGLWLGKVCHSNSTIHSWSWALSANEMICTHLQALTSWELGTLYVDQWIGKITDKEYDEIMQKWWYLPKWGTS